MAQTLSFSSLSGLDLVQLSRVVGGDWRTLLVGFEDYFPPGYEHCIDRSLEPSQKALKVLHDLQKRSKLPEAKDKDPIDLETIKSVLSNNACVQGWRPSSTQCTQRVQSPQGKVSSPTSLKEEVTFYRFLEHRCSPNLEVSKRRDTYVAAVNIFLLDMRLDGSNAEWLAPLDLFMKFAPAELRENLNPSPTASEIETSKLLWAMNRKDCFPAFQWAFAKGATDYVQVDNATPPFLFLRENILPSTTPSELGRGFADLLADRWQYACEAVKSTIQSNHEAGQRLVELLTNQGRSELSPRDAIEWRYDAPTMLDSLKHRIFADRRGFVDSFLAVLTKVFADPSFKIQRQVGAFFTPEELEVRAAQSRSTFLKKSAILSGPLSIAPKDEALDLKQLLILALPHWTDELRTPVFDRLQQEFGTFPDMIAHLTEHCDAQDAKILSETLRTTHALGAVPATKIAQYLHGNKLLR